MFVRALVIGANSFSGKHMISCLLKNGFEVIGTWAHMKPEDRNDIIWEYMDLLEFEKIQSVLEKYHPDRIFNFATQSSVSRAWADPGQTVEVNMNGAINLFESIRATGIDPIVVLVGAGEEYGRIGFDRMPVVETESSHPANIYAATMAGQTMMARIYHKAYGMRLIVARTFNVIGPGQPDNFVVSDFCHQGVLAERSVNDRTIYTGNINIQRDFTDIRDLVRAYLLLSEYGCAGEVYNVGTGHAVSIQTIIDCLKTQLGDSITIQVEKERIRLLDTPKLEGDVSKLRRDTGWEPIITLEQSIQDMLQFWRNHLE